MIYPVKSLQPARRGAASLITVIFVSIVLSIMVLGFVRLAINEQRQSTDNDLTNRAFYAAESGIEDAKRAIRHYLKDPATITLNENNCTLPVDTSATPELYSGVLSTLDEFDTEYTCMLIDLTPSSYEAQIEKNQTKQIELNTENGDGFTEILVEWHINDAPPDGDGVNPNLRSSTTLPTESNWVSSGYPAMLRTLIFNYGGSITRNDLNDSATIAFLNPATTAVGDINYNGSKVGDDYDVYNANCKSSTGSGEYVCSQLIKVDNGSGNNHYVLRLTSLYSGTHVKVTLQNSPSSIVNFEGTQVLVDVTGRAGDVYRRVESRLSLDSTFSDLLPDAAIVSADDICKNLAVGDDSTDFRDNDCTP